MIVEWIIFHFAVVTVSFANSNHCAGSNIQEQLQNRYYRCGFIVPKIKGMRSC